MTKLRMNAYYFGFDETGERSVDRVLSAVACAGKAFHHTEQWGEPCEAYMSETKGNSCREWIQNAANDAAAEHKQMREAFRFMFAAAERLLQSLDLHATGAFEGEDDLRMALDETARFLGVNEEARKGSATNPHDIACPHGVSFAHQCERCSVATEGGQG